jgi:hypothetical protein
MLAMRLPLLRQSHTALGQGEKVILARVGAKLK